MPDQPPKTPGQKPGQKSGWLDDLARRSTGLPEDETPSVTPARSSDTSLWRLAGLGLQFALTVSIFALMGREVDRRMDWSPWGLVSFTLVAVIGNTYLLIKDVMKDSNDGPGKTK